MSKKQFCMSSKICETIPSLPLDKSATPSGLQSQWVQTSSSVCEAGSRLEWKIKNTSFIGELLTNFDIDHVYYPLTSLHVDFETNEKKIYFNQSGQCYQPMLTVQNSQTKITKTSIKCVTSNMTTQLAGFCSVTLRQQKTYLMLNKMTMI